MEQGASALGSEREARSANEDNGARIRGKTARAVRVDRGTELRCRWRVLRREP